mgnify:CR=1 FL=1
MNRWVPPGAVVVMVGVATVVASLTGAQAVPEQRVTAAPARVSMVCPAFASATASVKVVAAATGAGLQVAKLAADAADSSAGQQEVLANVTEPVRVSALLPDPFGASSFATASSGPARGISVAGCVEPRTEHWFVGVDVGAEAQADLVVVNLDGTAASIDLTAYSHDGRIAAPRGVEVAGNSSQAISLSSLPRGDDPVTIVASSSDGRFAAFLRQRSWSGDTSLGGDWLAGAAVPASEQVIPGLADGTGARRLVVANPNERTTTVTVGFLGTSGPGAVAGAEQFEVPPETTRVLDLTAGLSGQAVTLNLTSTQPVTAAVWQDTGEGEARHDPAFSAATPPLPSDSYWPLAAGAKARTTLVLANPAAEPATATVNVAANTKPAAPQEVSIPAGTQVEVPIPAAATNTVRIRTPATSLRGALVTTRKLGKVQGLAVWPLADQESGGTSASVVYDPRIGR